MDKTEAPFVSVVIPAYKAERTILRAVDSVLAQQGVRVEVIVVVDGVFDRTAEVVEGRDPRVEVVVNETNQGAPKARNRGLALARGEFIQFLDSDDFVEGALLSGLTTAMRSAGADVGFGPCFRVSEGEGEPRPVPAPSFESTESLLRDWMTTDRFVGTTSVVWRVAFVRSIGGWFEGLPRNQDGELVIRALLGGAKVTVSTAGRGVYVQHESPERVSTTLVGQEIVDDVFADLSRRPQGVLDDAVHRELFAQYFYKSAVRSYRCGALSVGDLALARARHMGFRGFRGSSRHQALCHVLGLKRTILLLGKVHRARRRLRRG